MGICLTLLAVFDGFTRSSAPKNINKITLSCQTGQFNDTVGAAVERPLPTEPARKKYLYGVQVVVPGLAFCVCCLLIYV